MSILWRERGRIISSLYLLATGLKLISKLISKTTFSLIQKSQKEEREVFWLIGCFFNFRVGGKHVFEISNEISRCFLRVARLLKKKDVL